MKRYYEEGKLEEYYVRSYCFGSWNACVRYQLEMQGKPHPNWLRQDGVLDERLKPERFSKSGNPARPGEPAG
jgi:hypothetical protein